MNSQAVFFKYRTTTYISTLSLHDALPICQLLLQLRDHVRQRAALASHAAHRRGNHAGLLLAAQPERRGRKSTRLNSSHGSISYDDLCLKKKKTPLDSIRTTLQ